MVNEKRRKEEKEREKKREERKKRRDKHEGSFQHGKHTCLNQDP
jgi:hypothetical protein